jgi:hypothetical protein
VRRQLEQEENDKEQNGNSILSIEGTTPTGFIVMLLELEQAQ